MQIIREVGAERLVKHILFVVWQIVFDLLPFSPLRVLWLRLFGARIGKNTVVDKIDFINLDRTGLSGFVVGERCFLGRGAQFDLAGKIVIEDWVTISPRAVVLSHMTVGFSGHPLMKVYKPKVSDTKISEGVFVGVGAIILGGVRIGLYAVVGAGAVVTSDIASKVVVGGVPSKIIKRLKI